MALFKTFGMQNDDMLIFFLTSFRKVRFGKMQFLEDGVRTVVNKSMQKIIITSPTKPCEYIKKSTDLEKYEALHALSRNTVNYNAYSWYDFHY